MAESSSSVMAHVPARSISLPTRLIHPKTQRVEEELKKIQALNSSSSSTSSSIQLGLSRLVELYDFINQQVISSPQGQQALRLVHNATLVENALDDSISLLDVCDFTRDLIGTYMEQIQVPQSALRRRGGDFATIQSEIRTYINFQKKFMNAATKQLKSLARTQTRSVVVQHSGLDQHSPMVSNILKQSKTSAISVFKSLLQLISSKNGQFGCVDNSMIVSFYGRIIGKKIRKTAIDGQTMLGRLAMVNASLSGIEEELSYLSRRLIQHRASLLNIVTP